MHTNVYSLKSILESDLDPALCKLMLHQIKSPLLEHSFQITTDDENASYYQRHDQEELRKKKINNRPPSNINNAGSTARCLNEMSQVFSEHETTKRKYRAAFDDPLARNSPKNFQNFKPTENLISNTNSNSNYRNNQSNKFQFVSPLEYNFNMSRVDARNIETPNSAKFLLNEEETGKQQSEYRSQKGVAHWCGQIFDTKNAYENELILDEIEPMRFKRKKIFEKKLQLKAGTYPKYEHQTLSAVIKRLSEINQLQVARFVELIYQLLKVMEKITIVRKRILMKQSTMNKILLTYNPVDHQFAQTIQNSNRIKNRMNVKKVSDLINKILSKQDKNMNNLFCHQKQTENVEKDMSELLKSYSQVENIIQNYVSQRNIVADLLNIYNLLYEKDIKKLEMEEKFRLSHEDSLKNKIFLLLSSLKVDPDELKNLQQLDYIWSGICQPGGYSPSNLTLYKINRQKFINELCRNDIVIHEALKQQAEATIENKLSNLGYIRNQQ